MQSEPERSTDRSDGSLPEYIEHVANPDSPSVPQNLSPPQHGPSQLLDDQQLQAGGMVPVKAWLRSEKSETENALRIRRYREEQAAQGVKQLNVIAPANVHAAIKELAEKTRDGMPLAEAINEIAEEVGAAQEAGAPDVERLREQKKRLELRIQKLESEISVAESPSSPHMAPSLQICIERCQGLERQLSEAGQFLDIGRMVASLTGWRRHLVGWCIKMRL